MADDDVKRDLCRYLQDARDALLWKLRDISEYGARLPLVPTGSNLLGIVKHVAGVEVGYFGDTFGRPYEGWSPSFDGAEETNADMWATADESRQAIVDFYRAVWSHSDTTIRELPLDATGVVPWWPADRGPTTLSHILARVTAETNRHAGQADILRELVDGAAGWIEGNENLPTGDPEWWAQYRARLQEVADQFAE